MPARCLPCAHVHGTAVCVTVLAVWLSSRVLVRVSMLIDGRRCVARLSTRIRACDESHHHMLAASLQPKVIQQHDRHVDTSAFCCGIARRCRHSCARTCVDGTLQQHACHTCTHRTAPLMRPRTARTRHTVQERARIPYSTWRMWDRGRCMGGTRGTPAGTLQ